MYLNELIDTGYAAKLLNMPYTTLRWWIKRLALKPRWAGKGQGSTRIYCARQIWALAVARAIFDDGRPIDLAVKVAAMLETLEPDDIFDRFQEGRVCVVGGVTNGEATVLRGLFMREAAGEPDVVTEAREAGENIEWHAFNVRTSLLDLCVALKRHAEVNLN